MIHNSTHTHWYNGIKSKGQRRGMNRNEMKRKKGRRRERERAETSIRV